MCIIIVKTPGGKLSRKELKEAFHINDDGAGFMFDTPENTVKIFKGWFGFRKYYKAVRHCEELYPQSTFVLHMRIGTSGKRDTANCHPFRVSQTMGFAHNGVMWGLGNKERSDTREFVEDTLCKLPENFLDRDDINEAITQCAVASSSKYVFLLGDGSYFIFNEELGHWKDGCWYSNKSYTLPTRIVTPHTAAGAWNSHYPDASVYMCIGCNTVVGKDELGISDGALKLCHGCLDDYLGTSYIQCNVCLHDVPFTRKLLKDAERGHGKCEFCDGDITTEEIAWDLMSYKNTRGGYDR